MPTANDVAFREGAATNLDMVNVAESSAAKGNHSLGGGVNGPSMGSQLKTHLHVRAWVRNLAYTKSVWADVHVADEHGAVGKSATYTLGYSSSPDGNGDYFELNESVHSGSGSVPGSVWFGMDARKVQYRLYYEANGEVFTDGVLHEHDILPDTVVRNPHG